MMPFRQDPSDPEQAGPSLTSAAVYSSTGHWSNRNPGWGANHHILKSLTASTLPKSTLNVRNLGFPPAPCALPASAIGRPIGKLTQEQSSAAPACPLRLAACREWSTWASAALKGALVTSKLSYGQEFLLLHMSTAISPCCFPSAQSWSSQHLCKTTKRTSRCIFIEWK